MIVPIIAIRTGDRPPGSNEAIPKTIATPIAEPINEKIIIDIDEALGKKIIQIVIIKADPSETPIMEGDAR
ncbi:hypothetical protein D3C73_892140 [compost metagenome]